MVSKTLTSYPNITNKSIEKYRLSCNHLTECHNLVLTFCNVSVQILLLKTQLLVALNCILVALDCIHAIRKGRWRFFLYLSGLSNFILKKLYEASLFFSFFFYARAYIIHQFNLLIYYKQFQIYNWITFSSLSFMLAKFLEKKNINSYVIN